MVFTASIPETLHPGGLGLTKRVMEACAPAVGARLVDLGCGSGAAVQFLSHDYGFQTFGIDLRHDALKNGWPARLEQNLICARADHLPLRTASCDILLAECSLSTMNDQPGGLDSVLTECHRVLAQSGRLAISDLFRRESGSPRDAPAGSPLHLTSLPDQAGWITRLEANGFQVLFWEDHTPALKVMAAQAIFSGRSLDSLWGCCPSPGDSILPAAASCLRLGYLLLVAQKSGFMEM